DVNNPLLGLSGAAAVFGPQKGAAPAEVEILDAALARFAAVTASVTGLDLASAAGAGAAGGTGFGALAYLGAKLVPGVDLVPDRAASIARAEELLQQVGALIAASGMAG